MKFKVNEKLSVIETQIYKIMSVSAHAVLIDCGVWIPKSLMTYKKLNGDIHIVRLPFWFLVKNNMIK